MITFGRIVRSIRRRLREARFERERVARFEAQPRRDGCATQRYDSLAAYRADPRNGAAATGERALREAEWLQLASRSPIDIYCEAHQGTRPFRLDAGEAIDWREGLPCSDCRINARMRFCLGLMRGQTADKARHRVFLTEQATHGYVVARRIFPHTIGSEFVRDQSRRRALTAYLRRIARDRHLLLRHEDATRLSFPDASFDAVGSFDVLEHVPEYDAALREFARVLVPGGHLTLTAPFLRDQPHSVTRARVRDDGSIEHLLAAEYHGDPVDSGGVLCFHHFGWDLLDHLRAAGFARAEMVTAWTPEYGYLGAIEAIVAQR
jgi:SAM-dependent methyltransferase